MTLSRPAPVMEVIVNGVPRANFHPLFIGRYSGNRPLDFCTFEVIPDTVLVTNGELSSHFHNSTVQVRANHRDGGQQELHYGRISSMEVRHGPAGEQLIMHSRLDDHLLGIPLSRIDTLVRPLDVPESNTSMAARVRALSDDDLVFNPVFEGTPTANRAFNFRPTTRPGAALTSVFVDPRSFAPEYLTKRRNDLRVWVDGLNWWRLSDAVHYLCHSLNFAQTHVENPTLGDIRTSLKDVLDLAALRLRNHRVRKGTYLMEALDQLLRPHGFGVRVQLVSEKRRKLEFFERGKGAAIKNTKLDFVGANLDTTKSAVAGLSVNYDAVQNHFNGIQIYGAPIEREVSIILRPAWKEEFDDQRDASQYMRDEQTFKDDVDLQQAWRRFVANEGGNHTGQRDWWEQALDFTGIEKETEENKQTQLHQQDPDSTTDSDQDSPPDSGQTENDPPANEEDNKKTDDSVFSESVFQRRRQMYPTLTQDPEGTSLGRRHGMFLEYLDPDEISDDTELLPNGDFATAGSWNFGADWAHDAGDLEADATASSAELSHSVDIEAGKRYRVKYTVKNYGAGQVFVSLGGGTAGGIRSADGVYTETLTAGSTGVIEFFTAGFTGSIDDVSVKEQEGGWKIVGEETIEESFSWQPLEGEIGVWFSSPAIVDNWFSIVQDYGIEELMLRITCTIRSDERLLGARSAFRRNAILKDRKSEILDAGEAYKMKVVESSDPADKERPIGGSVFAGTTTITTAINDSARIDERSKDLVDKFSAATVEGTITIEGIDWPLTDAVGGTVRELHGRGFKFNTSPRGSQKRYPTCIGIEFNIQEQVSTLRMETFRNV